MHIPVGSQRKKRLITLGLDEAALEGGSEWKGRIWARDWLHKKRELQVKETM